MNKKILTSTLIGLIIVLIVLMANFGLVFAARGPKSKTASLNYANIGIANIAGIEGQPDISFGCFDKKKASTQGAADCFDIFGPDFMGIVTDSQNYKDLYDEVFAGIFPPAMLVDEDQLEIWKKGSDIYVELTVTLSFPTAGGGTFELPPLSMKISSTNEPYKSEIPPMTFPSGWTWSRITQRGSDAIVTFDCPTWGVSEKFLGTTEFNSLDTFTPPPT
ncbi:MAG: hypothetical protein JW702_04190 [Clostridiales bacterium]|nr:hypothetical protein [Clostridiales bacterium]